MTITQSEMKRVLTQMGFSQIRDGPDAGKWIGDYELMRRFAEYAHKRVTTGKGGDDE